VKKSHSTYEIRITTEIPRDSAKIPSAVVFVIRCAPEGMIRLETARRRSMLIIWASDTLKYCSRRFQPPRRKLKPVVSSRLDRMVPRRESFKTLTWRDLRSKIDKISWTALLV
jgi:hypothetical protein